MGTSLKTVAQVLKEGEQHLLKLGTESAHWEAEALLLHVLGWSRTRLYQSLHDELSADTVLQYSDLLGLRSRRVPLQYILGNEDFMGLSFHVDERVLIPRPETELLVEKVLFLLQGREKPLVADLGTGSGAIAVSLAVFHPEVNIMAVDVSPEALTVARENAKQHRVAERITFLQGDMLAPLQKILAGTLYDGIVSNPPYIEDSQLEQLAPEVQDFEPRLALSGGKDGLKFYRHFAQHAKCCLKPGGFIALEIGWDQGESVSALLANAGNFSKIRVQQDYAGRDRIVWATNR